MAARIPLLVLSTVLALAPGAAAQSAPVPDGGDHTRLTIEQLMSMEMPTVQGASRFSQLMIDAPSSITIVTREEIARLGYRTLADLLRGVRGFYVTYDRNYTYVGARGIARPGDYNGRILVLINGHRLNENVYDSVLIGTEFPVDLAVVDRVEIIRGPSSSLYGSNAFLAVVNVLTTGGATRSGVRGEVGAGTLGTRSVNISGGGLLAGGGEAFFAASTYHSDGQGDSRVSRPGMDADSASRLFGTASRGPWRAEGAVVSRRKVVPTGVFGALMDDPRSQTVDTRAYGRLSFEGRLRDALVTASASHDWFAYDGEYVTQPAAASVEQTRGRWWRGDGQVQRRMGNHRVTAGGEVRFNTLQDQHVWEETETDPQVVHVDDRRRSTIRAAFVQDEWRLHRTMLVSAGIRHDWHPPFGAAFSPRLGVIVKPSPTSAVKLLHGRAYRAPNAYESYYYSATPALEPERITTHEIVGELYEERRGRVAVSGFVYRVSHLISMSSGAGSDGEAAFFNEPEVRAAGIELEAERPWRAGWHAGASYALQQALAGASGERLSNSPGQTAKGRLTGPLVPARVSIGVDARFTGSRITVRGERIPSYATANLTIGSLPGRARGFSWSLHVNNVLDARYFDPLTLDHPVDRLQQDGRTFLARLSWRF